MSGLDEMVEYCTQCCAELEIGQIGLCDDCQEEAAADNAVAECKEGTCEK